jgi:amino acid adenylation domain-containing protein
MQHRLTKEEYQKIIIDWNLTDKFFGNDLYLHKLFEEQANTTPENIAVIFGKESLRYKELNAEANQLAHRLISLGVGNGDLIGILMARSLNMVVGMLAVLKAGAAYIPINPDDPEERIKFIIEDSRIKVILTQKTVNFKLKDKSIYSILMDETKYISVESIENPESDITEESTAYVMYTSGTTGQPKGAVIPHRAICNHMLWMNTSFNYSENDVFLQKAPFGFDASTWEFYAPLLVGGKLVVAEPNAHKDIKEIVRLIKDNAVTILQGVPSFYKVLADSGYLNECTSLRILFSGAEVLSKKLAQKIMNVINGDLYNVYGPAEACIQTTFWHYKNSENYTDIPAGKPIPNSKVYILDSNKQPVPINTIGEIYLGGKPVANGYLNREILTKEVFIPNPFIDNSILYKTGDLGKWNNDGALLFCGRIDSQVKISGHRIELGEIEATLRECHWVAVSAVITKSKTGGNAKICAYIVPADEQVTNSEIKIFLKSKLPDYMIPSEIYILSNMPLTSNGKIDVGVLKSIDQSSFAIGEPIFETIDKIEYILMQIWTKILDTSNISINDDFFDDLGGDSLNVMEMQFAASKEGLNLSAIEVKDNPTIKKLAEFINSKDR